MIAPHLLNLRRRLRAQSFDLRAPRLLFERTVLRAPRDSRGNAFRARLVQLLDLLAELLQTERLIPMLTAFLLRSDNNPGRQMPQTDSAFSLVDVLSSGSTRTKGLDLALTQQVVV